MLTPELVLAAVMLATIAAAVCRHLYIQERITAAQGLAASILVLYLGLVFASTVLGREAGAAYRYQLLPFWSYREIAAGNTRLLVEDLLNVFLLLPVGILLPVCSRRLRLPSVMAIGAVLSGSIEMAQLITKRGPFEFDDMFHNVAGTAVGYGVYAVAGHFMKTWKKGGH